MRRRERVPGRSPGLAPSEGYRRSVGDDAADRLAGVHQVEGIVDLIQRHLVRDQRIDRDLAVHVPVDNLWYVGASARAAERGAFPHASGDELERTCRDLLPRPRDADNHRYTPTAVAALERL